MAGKHQKRQVPVHLRDASYKGAARLGHGKGYEYPHSYEGHWVAQQYLPDIHKDRCFCEPSDEGYEAESRHGWSAGEQRGRNKRR